MGSGSSIDFQDHRPYFAGDDPRHIDWQAYARTGNYTMKLYREELTPGVDVVFDGSESMVCGDAKVLRSIELIYFVIESALRSGSAVRCHFATGSVCSPWPIESILSYAPPPSSGTDAVANAPPALHAVPWRAGSLRILISDLLFEGQPSSVTQPIVSSHGRVVIFAPFDPAEAVPDWNGNMELVDAEGGQLHNHRISATVMSRYQDAYSRHFALWESDCRRQGIRLARVPTRTAFLDALADAGAGSGAVDMV